LVCLLSLYCLASADTVTTPFGPRPRECVLEVPHGATVAPGKGDELVVKVTTEAGEVLVSTYKAPAHCGNDIADIYARRHTRKTLPPVNGIQATNGWLDNAFWESGDFKSFTATYVTPGNPVNNNGGQVLFYFVGLEDINSGPTALNILQPVLTWGNGYHEWYVKSWACCPKNITVSSPPLFGLKEGSQFHGEISRESLSTWLIDSVFDGKHTTLRAQVGDYNYVYSDVTLEVYYVETCQDFATGTATFNDLVLSNSQGNRLSPVWKYSNPTLCGGRIESAGGDSISIVHN